MNVFGFEDRRHGSDLVLKPSILEIACSACLTYSPTLVPIPMGWMLNSAVDTIRLFFRPPPNLSRGRSRSILLILDLADKPILSVWSFLAQPVRLLVLFGLVNV